MMYNVYRTQRTTSRLILHLLVTTGLWMVVCGIPSYSKELESELRTSLFTDYETLQRPSQLVTVTVGLNLVTINSLDIKDQIMSTSGFFSMEWNDDRLEWDSNSSYSNVRFLFSSEEYMWRPTLVVENRYAEKGGRIDPLVYAFTLLDIPRRDTLGRINPLVVNDLEVFSDENWLIRIKSSGDAYWTPGGIFETSCDVDITYYPLDTQTCSIVLTTWAYTSSEISLEFENPAVTTDNFSPNGEWDLLEYSTSSETASKAPHDSNTYSRLYFNLTMKRRPLFHVLNTIFPVLLMASLIVFVFKLPPESGERVGMSLTVLLAYAVYLTLIADNIPKTSLSTSILSTYLTIILMLSTLSVILTIVVLDIYFNHDDDEEPPSWIQSLTRTVLVKISMWKGERCCRKQRPKVNPNITKEHSMASTTDIKLPLDDFIQDKNARTRYRGHKTDIIDVKPAEAEDDVDGVKVYSWKEVALILDRCFMYLFILLTVVTTVVCLGILASK